jgi:hypothetical protein
MYKYIYIHKETGKKVFTNHKLDEQKFELFRELKQGIIDSEKVSQKV